MHLPEALLITQLDVGTVQHFCERLFFYWGSTDEWSPLAQRDELLRQVPAATVVTDAHDIPHAFSLQHSDTVAAVCWEEVREAIGAVTREHQQATVTAHLAS